MSRLIDLVGASGASANPVVNLAGHLASSPLADSQALVLFWTHVRNEEWNASAFAEGCQAARALVEGTAPSPSLVARAQALENIRMMTSNGKLPPELGNLQADSVLGHRLLASIKAQAGVADTLSSYGAASVFSEADMLLWVCSIVRLTDGDSYTGRASRYLLSVMISNPEALTNIAFTLNHWERAFALIGGIFLATGFSIVATRTGSASARNISFSMMVSTALLFAKFLSSRVAEDAWADYNKALNTAPGAAVPMLSGYLDIAMLVELADLMEEGKVK